MPMTGKPTVPKIDQWIREGRAQGARWLLCVWDRFPWPPEPYPMFIAPGENLAQRFAALDGHGMQRVYAVHFLN